jgi:serine/threonine-protein kinase
MITKEDISQIKKETGRIQLPEEDDDYGYDDDYEEDEYDDDEYDDDDYDDDDEYDDDDDMDPRMEKIMTIGGIAAAVIILIIIIMLAGKVLGFGLFKGKEEKPEEPQQTEQEAEETVQMIDITGMTYDDAKMKLNEMGIGIKSAGSEESDEYEEGQIMRQSVEADTVIEKGTTVEVTIAIKKIEMIKIPDITGQTKEDAKYRLEQEGFLVDFTESFHDSVASGKVIKTSPDVGTEQEKGTTVYLTISKGKEKKNTTVPGVVNTTRENAEVALKNAGLSVGSTTEAFSDTVAAGNVISQSIAKDTTVEEGVTVDLVISKGPEKVTMPNLWGNPKDRAIEKLRALGLSVEVYEEYSDDTEGRVFKTSPAADEKIAPGSMVQIYLSKGPKPEDNNASENENSESENSESSEND